MSLFAYIQNVCLSVL